MPQGIDGALLDGPEPQLQRHSLPIGRHDHTSIHGHGVGTDDDDVINLRRYFQRVEDGLQERLKNDRASWFLPASTIQGRRDIHAVSVGENEQDACSTQRQWRGRPEGA